MPREMGLHDHLAELRRSLIPPIVLASLIAILSATSDNIVSWIAWWLDLYGDSSGRGLSVYAPHDWYVLKWSAAILLGITCTHPFLCFNLWKFVESGLIETEKKVVSTLFLGVSFLLPVAVIAIVFASPSKSHIRVLQSIGRGLRKTDDGKETTLYDIVDDISWKSRKNFGILHADERLRIYGREKFNHKTYKVKL